MLPNDPRGSGSRTVAAPLLAELGELHFGRKRNQPAGHIVREFYERAAERLIFPVVRFSASQIEIVGETLAQAITSFNYTCYACAVMPEHVHLVMRKHKHLAEEMIHHLQEFTRLRLMDRLRFSTAAGMSPEHPVWTLGGWKRFVDFDRQNARRHSVRRK